MIIPEDLLHCALEFLLSDNTEGNAVVFPCAIQTGRQIQDLCNYFIADYLKKNSHQI